QREQAVNVPVHSAAVHRMPRLAVPAGKVIDHHAAGGGEVAADEQIAAGGDGHGADIIIDAVAEGLPLAGGRVPHRDIAGLDVAGELEIAADDQDLAAGALAVGIPR